MTSQPAGGRFIATNRASGEREETVTPSQFLEQALQRQGKKLKESSLAEMDALWQEAKEKKK